MTHTRTGTSRATGTTAVRLSLVGNWIGRGCTYPSVRAPSPYSARWRCQVLPHVIPARLLAPKRRDDDLEQRAHTRPRQRRHPRVSSDRLAMDAARPAHVRLDG